MLIEIHGAGFKNKGAQLMLQTVVEKLSEEIPDCECCISAGGDRPAMQVGKLGLRYIWPTKILEGRRGKFLPLFKATNFLSTFVSESRLKPYGLVKRSQSNALIDISGFTFSDMWGSRPIKKFSALASFYSKRGCPVVMLPQMFGPFDRTENIRLFQEMTSHCSLVYARDTKSFEIANKCAAASTKVSLAPDITLFQEVVGSSDIDKSGPKTNVILVPNMRVLDMGTDWNETTYLQSFVDVGKKVMAVGLGVQILIHETFGKDAKLAEKICDQLGLDESHVFVNEDPNKLKSKIARGLFLVGSRFHSLAGALSTATPVVAIGWAHKYGQLLADFGVEKFDIKSAKESDRLLELVEQLLDHDKRAELITRLKQSKQCLVGTNQNMWAEVIKVLKDAI